VPATSAFNPNICRCVNPGAAGANNAAADVAPPAAVADAAAAMAAAALPNAAFAALVGLSLLSPLPSHSSVPPPPLVFTTGGCRAEIRGDAPVLAPATDVAVAVAAADESGNVDIVGRGLVPPTNREAVADGDGDAGARGNGLEPRRVAATSIPPLLLLDDDAAIDMLTNGSAAFPTKRNYQTSKPVRNNHQLLSTNEMNDDMMR
jgi:hypothetical protein